MSRPPGTHCQRGHEFTPENTLACADGRRCLACRRASSKNRPKGYWRSWQSAARAKAAGLCVQCLRRPMVTKNHCEECRQRINARVLARYHAKRASHDRA